MDASHEERLVRRIEAFSDLVIGFSLALLGLTLVIPPRAIQLIIEPVWLLSYLWTFGTITLMWFNHQRLFATYFYPNGISIVLNFTLLASLGLVVYFVQVFLHAQTEPDHAVGLLLYFAAFSVTMLCMGSLYALGTRQRWHTFDGRQRYDGVSRATRSLAVGTSLMIGVIATPFAFVELQMRSTVTLAYAVIAGMVIARVALRFYKARIIGSARAVA